MYNTKATKRTQSGGGGDKRVGNSGGEGKGVSERETMDFMVAVGTVLYQNSHKLESQLLAKLISHNTHTHTHTHTLGSKWAVDHMLRGVGGE